MRRVLLLALLFGAIAAGSVSAQSSYEGCGVLVWDSFNGATLFDPAGDYKRYYVDHHDGFVIGDSVWIEGTVDWFCDAATLWQNAAGCIQVSFIEDGAEESGTACFESECCKGLSGNFDDDPDDICDIGDLTALIEDLFICFGCFANCTHEANIDGDSSGIIDIGDLTALIEYLFIPPYPPPSPCP